MQVKKFMGIKRNFVRGFKICLVPNNFWMKKIWVEVICWVKNFPVKVFVWGQKNCLDPKISGKNFWDQKFLFLKNLRSKNVLRLKKIYGQNLFCC